jgi:hypothetical protein
MSKTISVMKAKIGKCRCDLCLDPKENVTKLTYLIEDSSNVIKMEQKRLCYGCEKSMEEIIIEHEQRQKPAVCVS